MDLQRLTRPKSVLKLTEIDVLPHSAFGITALIHTQKLSQLGRHI